MTDMVEEREILEDLSKRLHRLCKPYEDKVPFSLDRMSGAGFKHSINKFKSITDKIKGLGYPATTIYS